MAAKKNGKSDNIHPLGKSFLWMEIPENIGRMIAFLVVICLLLFVAEFAIYRKSHFSLEAFPGFYGFFGFAAFSFIIFSTKVLKLLINRKEDYYGDKAVDREHYPPNELEIKRHGDD